MEEDQHQHQHQHPEDETLEEDEVEKLEEQVKLMAQKIAEYRQTLPDQLKNTLALVIEAHGPDIGDLTRVHGSSDPGPSTNPNLEVITPLNIEGGVEVSVEKDPEYTEKVEMIKRKISANASAMPLLVKRIKDCTSRIDKLEAFKQDMIHPAFTRKRTT